jgi:hypothetical protein
MKRAAVVMLAGPVFAVAVALAGEVLAQAPAPKSLDSIKGAFHESHASSKVGLSCSACHTWTKIDPLVLRFEEIQGPGPVDRNGCITCHKPPAQPVWYFIKPSG